MVCVDAYHPLYEMLRKMLAGQTVHLVRTACTVDYYLSFRMSPWFLQSDISGGPIAEQAVHLLDCVRWLLDEPALRVIPTPGQLSAADRPLRAVSRSRPA